MRFVKVDIKDVMKVVRDYIDKRSLPKEEARMVSKIMDMYMNTPYVYNKLIVYVRTDFSKACVYPWKLGKKAIFIRTKNGDDLPRVINATESNLKTLRDLQTDKDFSLFRNLMIANDIRETYTTGVYDFVRRLYYEGCPQGYEQEDEPC